MVTSVIGRLSKVDATLCALVLLGASIGDGRSAELIGSRASGPRDASNRAVHRADGAPARRPFQGFWAADHAACLDADSDGRMAFRADTIDWYETRCRIQGIAPAGRSVWRLNLACRGEGQRIQARATVSLPTIDALIIDDGPIGPSRRQRYIRCKPQ